ncbi:alpha-1,6-mannosyl-glycoprotein 4-beta-N-acetylglucosaminyltransferase-like isoform X2 [Acropora muricata]|uniref:alpha-1,6-mannosyl-glycoprotein 4-beta-N-acetylglucosaminyltransferase-like isoform X2 n=1 Tax=Acropora muricata TaxID=159855 RepID=UPI0034E60034
MWRKSNSYLMHRKVRRVCWCILNCIALLSVIAVTFSTSRWLGCTLPIATEEPQKINGQDPSVCFDENRLSSQEINKLGKYPRVTRFLSIGISSIKRPFGQNYLPRTIQLLIGNLSEEKRKELYIVIFLADLSYAHNSAVSRNISFGFKTDIDNGLLHAIFAPQEYYPRLTNLKEKFGDSKERIFWRSKLVIDFSFLMCYCKDLSQYYLHLEDDVIPAPSFYPKLKDFIASQRKQWTVLDVALQGAIAKVYQSTDLERLATFLYLMYDELPVDWLIDKWRNIKHSANIFAPASLFQHVGHHSSLLENNVSHLFKEGYFDKYDQKYKGLNPVAVVSASMQNSHLKTKPELAYGKGLGYFWVKGIKKGDFIDIEFTSLTEVRKVFVDTGANFAASDQLKHGILQASFQNETMKEAGHSGRCKNFETIGYFQRGKVEVFVERKRNVNCLRILVTGDQDKWLLVREIDVWDT